MTYPLNFLIGRLVAAGMVPRGSKRKASERCLRDEEGAVELTASAAHFRRPAPTLQTSEVEKAR